MSVLLPNLTNYRIILASASPRRKALLEQIGVKFDVIPSTFEETKTKPSLADPADFVIAIAKGKAHDVFSEHMDSVVIGADTVVVLDDKILEKPRDAQDAREMLAELSGSTHRVLTGVCICYKNVSHAFHVDTEVKLGELTADIIERYVATGEPLDKAGSYGIQAMGAVLVERINGCYFNVMGLPLRKLTQELEKILI